MPAPLRPPHGPPQPPADLPPSPRVLKILTASKHLPPLEIYKGMCRDDVLVALRTLSGLSDKEDFVLENMATGAIVPVSAALPGGIKLLLKPLARVPHVAIPEQSKDSAIEEETASIDRSGSKHQTEKKSIKRDHTPLERMASKMLDAETALQNFSKIGSYQANERTLLAWQRTGLATCRTAFAFLSLSGGSQDWQTLLEIMTVCMAMLSPSFMLVGYLRFWDVRSALDTNAPSEDMLVRIQKPRRQWREMRWWQQLLRTDTATISMSLVLVAVTFAVCLKGFVK